jgi:ABC-type uncharacterized transport system auxiliary subunit
MLNSFLKTALLLILLLAGCKIDRDKPVDRNKFTFHMADDDNLFFRNVRQIYYNRSSRMANGRPIVIKIFMREMTGL